MQGTSSARNRQYLIIVCLGINFILSICIIGLVGVHGMVTFENLTTGCLLFMTREGDVLTYNNAYCIFPIVGSAVMALATLLLLIFLGLVIVKNDEFSPRPMSIFFIVFSGLLALLAFAICAEIGIGLNKGCNLLGDQSYRCRRTSNFNALWGAEICAGLIGGFFVIATVLEVFQLKAHTRARFSSTVAPQRAGADLNTTSAVATPYQTPATPYQAPATAPPIQKTEYADPEMTQNATGYAEPPSQYYQPPQPPPQPQQNTYYAPPPPPTATYTSPTLHPTDPNGVVSYGYQM
ncbi:hypothetical protein EDD21DRAFT_375787 [Dissophora ornata]|nr:hypothetical protein BGZ58_008254 [Dissophora ornata]KAI8600958.1 hypothetical protein EDD21DRAFT_375787 [Dissophora ornata]